MTENLAERYAEAKLAYAIAAAEASNFSRTVASLVAAEAELDATVREMLDGLYECVDVDSGSVRYVGVYVLNWNKVSVLYEPEVAFREVNADAILGPHATDGGNDDL